MACPYPRSLPPVRAGTRHCPYCPYPGLGRHKALPLLSLPRFGQAQGTAPTGLIYFPLVIIPSARQARSPNDNPGPWVMFAMIPAWYVWILHPWI